MVASIHMPKVRCQARFLEKHIQNFGPTSIGRINLKLSSRHVIPCATSRLHVAGYQYLAIDDPCLLKAFANGRDAKDYSASILKGSSVLTLVMSLTPTVTHHGR